MDSNFLWWALFLTSSMSKTLVMYLAISPNAFPRAALAGQHRRIVHIVHDPGGVDSYHPKELKSNESRQGAVELQSQFSGISNYVL